LTIDYLLFWKRCCEWEAGKLPLGIKGVGEREENNHINHKNQINQWFRQ